MAATLLDVEAVRARFSSLRDAGFVFLDAPGGSQVPDEVGDAIARTLRGPIPMPIFKKLTTNLPKPYMDAAEALPARPAGKVGFQAERFWETKDQIYGGISWTTDDITQIWYPSSGFLSRKGVLTGAYMSGEVARRFNEQPIAKRLQTAKEQGERLHPGYAQAVELGLAIGWNNMEFEQFGWADEDSEAFGPAVKVLQQPQMGRFHMAGDQITYWSGWQEGALISARPTVVSWRFSISVNDPSSFFANSRMRTVMRACSSTPPDS